MCRSRRLAKRKAVDWLHRFSGSETMRSGKPCRRFDLSSYTLYVVGYAAIRLPGPVTPQCPNTAADVTRRKKYTVVVGRYKKKLLFRQLIYSRCCIYATARLSGMRSAGAMAPLFSGAHVLSGSPLPLAQQGKSPPRCEYPKRASPMAGRP
jgi:hypothetical protein